MDTKILLENGTNELEVLEFTLDGNLYGINVAKIREIINYQEVTPVPNAHPSIEGIFMPRDKTDFSDMRNKRDVWSVAINSAHIPGHFAVYPEKLIEPCILAGTKVGGIVLDPFFGSGTTGVAAIKNGRQYIGIDINPDYCKTAQDRIEKIKNETEMNDFGNQNK